MSAFTAGNMGLGHKKACCRRPEMRPACSRLAEQLRSDHGRGYCQWAHDMGYRKRRKRLKQNPEIWALNAFE